MTICQSTLCSLVVASGLLVGVIDSAGSGPGVVQVITVDTGGDASAYVAALQPLIVLLKEIAPRSEVQVLERTDQGDPTGAVIVLVRHPNLIYLEGANERAQQSKRWNEAVRNLESTGRMVETREILLDRTPQQGEN